MSIAVLPDYELFDMYVFKICIVLYLYVNCMFNVVRITVLSVYGQDLFEKNKRSVITDCRVVFGLPWVLQYTTS